MKLVVQSITHRCPYRDQDVPLAGCYVNSQDIEHHYCYGCTHVPTLRSTYGLRTFKRVLAGDTASSLRYVYAPTSHGGCHWLVVDLETGERMALGEYAAMLVKRGNTHWQHLVAEELAGAPAQFEEDKQKIVAAALADRTRGSRRI